MTATAIDVVEAQFSFLTSGPPLRVRLPDDFDQLPTLSSPILSGVGARSFTFHPARIEPDLARAGNLLAVMRDRDGREVELFERHELPLIWWLRWRLENGALTTHLREEDRIERAELVVTNLGIVEDSTGGTPFLLPDPPLRPEVLAEVGYEESAAFLSAARSGWSLRFQRPSYVPQGTTMVLPTGDFAVLRAGTPLGIEVQVTAGTNLPGGHELLSSVLSSLAAV